jgi:hypothetical protein
MKSEGLVAGALALGLEPIPNPKCFAQARRGAYGARLIQRATQQRQHQQRAETDQGAVEIGAAWSEGVRMLLPPAGCRG